MIYLFLEATQYIQKHTRRYAMTGEGVDKNCDIKVWCGECKRSEYTTQGEKYLCVSCGKIMNLGHEVHHEIFPHVSGDKDHLS